MGAHNTDNALPMNCSSFILLSLLFLDCKYTTKTADNKNTQRKRIQKYMEMMQNTAQDGLQGQ
jgi:hypothetical protein